MLTVLTWIILALYPTLFARRDSYAAPADLKLNKYWHAIGWVLRATFAYYACPQEFIIAYGFYFWIAFDIQYNYWTDKPIFYIGKTAGFDKLLRRLGGNWPKFAGFGIAIGFRIFDIVT